MYWRAGTSGVVLLGLVGCSNFAVDQPTAMTADEAFVVQQHIFTCWKVPPGGERAAPVSLSLEMNPDGTVRRATVAPSTTIATPLERSVADSALAAVRDPSCNPLPFPPAKQALWARTVIQLDPKAR